MSAPPKPDDVARALSSLGVSDATTAPTAAAAASTAAASESASSSAPATSAVSSTPASASALPAGMPDLSQLSKEDLLRLMAAQMGKRALAAEPPAAKEFRFWNTQPVPKIDETPTEHGPIETKTVGDISTSSYPLPANFEWDSLDMTDEKQVAEVYTLLYENYVEDDDNMFRFDYSSEFLKWALMPPGYRKEWHVGVRSTTNRKLVAFISGIPQRMRAYKDEVMMVEINYLVVHKKLRAKRLAPVLIKEITRRVNLQDIWQAVYTAGVVLPKAIAQNRYYHRSLNPKKLIDIGFSRLHRNMTMTRTIKLYKVADQPQINGFRQLTKEDIPAVHTLLSTYLQKFNLAPVFTVDELAHWLTPRTGVIDAYVVQAANGKITDLCSFYHLPSTIIGNKTYNTMRAAYSFYNVTHVPTEERWNDLMGDALIMAKKLDMDVFNALNVMENDKFLKPLKFGEGDGHLQYYLYNWKAPAVTPNNVGLVLL